MYVSYLVLIRFAFIIAERFVNNLICIVRVRAHTITSLLLLNLSRYIAAAAEGEGLGQSEHAMSAAVKIPPLALPHSETGKPLELGPAIVSECALRISLSSPQVACS